MASHIINRIKIWWRCHHHINTVIAYPCEAAGITQPDARAYAVAPFFESSEVFATRWVRHISFPIATSRWLNVIALT